MVDDNINLRVTDPIKHSIIVTADNVEYYDDNSSFFKIETGFATEILDNVFVGKTISYFNIYTNTKIRIIGANAFKNCVWKISKISFKPYYPTTIKSQAFANCSGLTTINYGGTKEQWNNVTKADDWNVGTPLTIICTDGTIIEKGKENTITTTYYKPQIPIKYGSSKYIYPLTTADQVVTDSGERLNAFLKNAVFQDLTGATAEQVRRQSNDSGTTVAVRDDINSNDVQVARLVAVLK